ncbi:hypothetical protein CCHL11_00287 [Colletotrichum chlorophyti]|uniref:Uncharacterized protein n=1 Tax=Colletotrichum chlorophyti TaxID=708187 RepID=A0A1Q8RUZ4_9PEZI|nr:hypothetical protein CCHL11_00287 [Colletotrichum chlorophyti]
MAPKRQAALAAEAWRLAYKDGVALQLLTRNRQNMAAVAAREASVDIPVRATKVAKNVKPFAVKVDAKVPGNKLSSKKTAIVKQTSYKSAASKATASKSRGIKAAENHQIPLVCVVCPNEPRFSDISHLLTHLSSKGHLHLVNDTRIRSHADPSAHGTISNYDGWYKKHNLESMLAERLLAKDKASTSKGKRLGQPPTKKTSKKRKMFSALVKSEPGDESVWTPSPSSGHSFELQQPITFSENLGDNPTMSPTEDVGEGAEDDLELTRLKGTVWPGMGIFDAATADQKKKRNQRKDASVLHQMKIDSQAITATEMVANLDLEIERTRDVYDAPSVDGTPPPKKSKRRQRRSIPAADDASELVVKAEPRDELIGRAIAFDSVQPVEPAQEHDISIEADSESASEKLDVMSDISSIVDADADAEVDIDYDIDADLNDDDDSLHDFTSKHLFNLPDDVFRNENRGITRKYE